jgi:hypothetical protein
VIQFDVRHPLRVENPHMDYRRDSDLLSWTLSVLALLIMVVAVRYSSTSGASNNNAPNLANPQFHSGSTPADQSSSKATHLQSATNAARSSSANRF